MHGAQSNHFLRTQGTAMVTPHWCVLSGAPAHSTPILLSFLVLPGPALCGSFLPLMSLYHLSLLIAVTGPAFGHHHFCF